MNSPELKKLIELLDYPDQLKLIIDKSRIIDNLDSAVLGFIAMYDSLDSDCLKMKEQLLSNKRVILTPIAARPQKSLVSLFVRYAAIVMVLVTSSLFVYSYFSKNRLELTTQFNDPGIPNFMSLEQNHGMSSIMYYYQKKEYEKADALIQMELKLKPANDTLNYYASVVTFLDERGDLGFKGFERLVKGNGKYKEKALYYQGLIYVHQGKDELAISRFKEVVLLEDEDVSLYAKAHIKQLELYQKSR
jgi:hypothetical protein